MGSTRRVSSDQGIGGSARRGAGIAAIALAISLGAFSPARSDDASPSAEPHRLAPILAHVSPAVVTIDARLLESPVAKPGVKSRLAARRAPEPDFSTGSGVILDAERGLIITNNHVIAHAADLTVTLVDGRELAAKLVGADAATDVAVIQVPADDLTAISFGNSGKLQVGDFVLLVGNPPPMGRTVTAGIVGALHRSGVGIAEAEDFIQTDAAVYPGDSGGALVDMEGRLVGINTGYLGWSATNSGMGFAIPVNLARAVAEQIVERGGVRHGMLGVTFEDAEPGAIHAPNATPAQAGPVVQKVDAGSAAEHAGLKRGDVVTTLNGFAVRSADELHGRLGLEWAGNAVELTVWRSGQRVAVRAIMSEQPRSDRPAR